MPAERASFRGAAQPANVSAYAPLNAISQPLLLPGPGEDPPLSVSWTQALTGAAGEVHGDFAKLLKTKRTFGVGGLQLVIKCGLVQDWYNDDANRRDAMDLIEERGARDLLDTLKDKDGPLTIFGKNDIRSFFKTFPPVERPGNTKTAEVDLSVRVIRKEHPLRLRKVIEFLFLTEAVLRYRFRSGETRTRFEEVTGIAVEGEHDAVRLWDYMWIEPLLYVLTPEPRQPDVDRIMRQPELLREFSAISGQQDKVLYWALRGAPCTYPTAKAAAAVCNRYYRDAAPTYAVAVFADAFDLQKDRLDHKANIDYVQHIENIVRLTP